jgi:hypothetical protein
MGTLSVEVIDLTGITRVVLLKKKMAAGTIRQQIVFSLPAGFYTVKVQHEDEVVFKKMTLQ